jgi:hypothetical protein
VTYARGLIAWWLVHDCPEVGRDWSRAFEVLDTAPREPGSAYPAIVANRFKNQLDQFASAVVSTVLRLASAMAEA